MIPDALFYSILAGLITGVGSLFAYFFTFNNRLIAFSFGFSSGVMLVVSYFSLLPAAVEFGDLFSVIIGLSCAVFVMWLLHRLPFSKVHQGCSCLDFGRVGVFLIFAVIAHHIPEGAAIGVGFEAEHHVGLLLVIALAIHNLPEGIALAIPLISAGKSPRYVMGWSLLCGMTLPLGTWIGMTWLSDSMKVMSVSLAFAATTMVWIIIYEIFPKAFGLNKFLSVFGLVVGGCVIYFVH